MASKYIDEETKTELAAAADYQERTGKNFFSLSMTAQRKCLENYIEDQKKESNA